MPPAPARNPSATAIPRRCICGGHAATVGCTTRAVIFTSLVDDPDDPDANPAFVTACEAVARRRTQRGTAKGDSPRMRLFDFIERLVTWEATTDEKIMGQARDLIRVATNDNPPPLLDPFAGGGSIPLEAQRLGLEAHASDLNPVAVMINKAMIEIPPRFADMPPVNPDAPLTPPSPSPIKREGDFGRDTTWKGAAGLAADVRYYGEWMRERAFEKIGHLYPKHNDETVIAWLWARTVTCPNPACQATMPLMSSFSLSKKKGRNAWLEPIPCSDKSGITFTVKSGNPTSDESRRIQSGTGLINAKGKKVKATFLCPVCSSGIAKGDYIDAEADKGLMGTQPTAIVTQGKSGRSYYAITSEQHKVAAIDAPNHLAEHNIETPQERARGTFASNAQGRIYGFKVFADYFTPRQLAALTTFSDLVHEARELATQDALCEQPPSVPPMRWGADDDGVPLREGGRGARAYGEAVSVYLAFERQIEAGHG